jgi:diketogulonate reductase-like aldo/keto reductase
MEGLYQAGQVKALGVSNVSAEQLELLLQSCRVKPQFVQNRCYAQLGWDRAVRRLCESHGLRYQGFSLLTANRALWQSSLLSRLAERYKRSPATLIFSLAQALNMIPITGTTDPQHMRVDLESSATLLSPDHVSQLEQIYDERQ